MSLKDVEFRVSHLDPDNEVEMRFLFETRRHPLVAKFLLGLAPETMEVHTRWVRANIPSKRMMFLARVGVGLVGYCHAYGFENRGPVEAGFVVHPDWQGKGVGGKMVDWLVAEVERVFPGRGVMLKVKSDNGRACGLYEKKGFVCVDREGLVVTYVKGVK